jgi:hypothetical protein
MLLDPCLHSKYGSGHKHTSMLPVSDVLGPGAARHLLVDVHHVPELGGPTDLSHVHCGHKAGEVAEAVRHLREVFVEAVHLELCHQQRQKRVLQR